MLTLRTSCRLVGGLTVDFGARPWLGGEFFFIFTRPASFYGQGNILSFTTRGAGTERRGSSLRFGVLLKLIRPARARRRISLVPQRGQRRAKNLLEALAESEACERKRRGQRNRSANRRRGVARIVRGGTTRPDSTWG